MGDVFKKFEYDKKQAEQEFFNIFLKIPEVFIFAVSVVIIFLSTVDDIDRTIFYYVAVIAFFIVLSLSVTVLFILKSMHRRIANMSRKCIDRLSSSLKKYKKGEISMDIYKKEITQPLKEMGSPRGRGNIKLMRKIADIILWLSFVLFLLGLFSILFI